MTVLSPVDLIVADFALPGTEGERRTVQADGHAAEVLAAIRELQ